MKERRKADEFIMKKEFSNVVIWASKFTISFRSL